MSAILPLKKCDAESLDGFFSDLTQAVKNRITENKDKELPHLAYFFIPNLSRLNPEFPGTFAMVSIPISYFLQERGVGPSDYGAAAAVFLRLFAKITNACAVIQVMEATKLAIPNTPENQPEIEKMSKREHSLQSHPQSREVVLMTLETLVKSNVLTFEVERQPELRFGDAVALDTTAHPLRGRFQNVLMNKPN